LIIIFMRQLVIKISRALFGWPPAPASFLEKKNLISQVAQENKLTCFVENGTFRGEMIAAQHEHFQKLFSIELSRELFEACRARFAGDEKIQLCQGDSGVKLGEVAAQVVEPALFWLDAHYSYGNTAGGDSAAPIIKELSCLALRKQANDAILIDDARLFGLKSGYPKLEVIRKYASQYWPRHQFAIQSDIICILPSR